MTEKLRIKKLVEIPVVGESQREGKFTEWIAVQLSKDGHLIIQGKMYPLRPLREAIEYFEDK